MLLSFISIFLFLFPFSNAFTIELLPTERLCMHEDLKASERMMVGFQVQDGPDFDIAFEVLHALNQYYLILYC
jgi:hypothetical protein